MDDERAREAIEELFANPRLRQVIGRGLKRVDQRMDVVDRSHHRVDDAGDGEREIRIRDIRLAAQRREVVETAGDERDVEPGEADLRGAGRQIPSEEREQLPCGLRALADAADRRERAAEPFDRAFDRGSHQS